MRAMSPQKAMTCKVYVRTLLKMYDNNYDQLYQTGPFFYGLVGALFLNLKGPLLI